MNEKTIDVIARAICSEPTTPTLLPTWRRHQRQAHAVLSALEALGLKIVPVVPTEAMVEAGWFQVSIDHPAQSDFPRGTESAVYAAMLNAVEPRRSDSPSEPVEVYATRIVGEGKTTVYSDSHPEGVVIPDENKG